MKVLFVSNEVAPWAKVGGLGDVAGTLPPALADRGVEIAVVMPLHRQCLNHGRCDLALDSFEVPMAGRKTQASIMQASLEDGKVPLYFINYGPYFDRPEIYGEGGKDYPDAAERYAFFCRAEDLLPDAMGFGADVIHANDWPTGLVPSFTSRPTLYTIHNLGYQGEFPATKAAPIGLDLQTPKGAALLHNGRINYMAAGIRTATIISTVSERYAQEIQTEEFGAGLDRLLKARTNDVFGVLNGIDYDTWSPKTDQALPANFSRDDLGPKAQCKAALQAEMGLPQQPDVPLVGCVSRMAWQKGLDILADAMEQAVRLPMQLAILGTGEAPIEKRYDQLQKAYPHAIAASLRYDDALARRIYAGSDMFAMPSRYEPCGLGQMIAMAYGTVPVVYTTGGLADTVTEQGEQTGFVFDKLSTEELLAALKRACDAYRTPEAWSRIVQTAMAKDFSWDDSARRYEQLYETALSRA